MRDFCLIMVMSHQHIVFTPLRIALLTAVVLSNVLALISVLNPEATWSDALGVYAVVFILLFVFVILLEMVWIYHMRKSQTDAQVRQKYAMALLIYGVFFVLGFFTVYGYLLG